MTATFLEQSFAIDPSVPSPAGTPLTVEQLDLVDWQSNDSITTNEVLAPGDLADTLEHGPQPLRWSGRRTVDGRGRLAPVRFAKRALGNRRALAVAPQHCILVTGWQAELLFGAAEALVAAVHPVDRPGIARPWQRRTASTCSLTITRSSSQKARPRRAFTPAASCWTAIGGSAP